MSANRRLKRNTEVAQAKRLRKQHRSEYAQVPIRNPTATSNKEYWDWIRSVAEGRHSNPQNSESKWELNPKTAQAVIEIANHEPA